MNFAVGGATRSPTVAWEELQSKRRQKQKQGRTVRLAKGKRRLNINPAEVMEVFWGCLARALIVFAIASGAYFGYLYLTQSPRFDIARVVLYGNGKLSREQLMARAGPMMGENIFMLNLDGISKNLAAHPWIRSVWVKRSFPQTLEIQVERREPYARIELDRVYVMDNFGILLEKDRPEYSSLPLLTGYTRTAPKPGDLVATEPMIRGLQTMHHFNQLPFFKSNPIDTVRLESGERMVFLRRNRDFKVVMDMETVPEGFKNLVLVLETLDERDGELEFIDLSFKNQVIVKHKPATHRTAPLEKS